MLFKSAFSDHVSCDKFFDEPSLTKQSFAIDCDINHIMAQFAETGTIEHAREFKGSYGDFLDVQDYHTSLNQIRAAEDMFDALSSKVRYRFDNDPAKFLEFVGNPDNVNEMITLGLMESSQALPSSSESVSAE